MRPTVCELTPSGSTTSTHVDNINLFSGNLNFAAVAESRWTGRRCRSPPVQRFSKIGGGKVCR
jgi:hypothetical protein